MQKIPAGNFFFCLSSHKRLRCCYSHVRHDFVQEDAVHQLHEHVDALLGADGVAGAQRAEGPHLQGRKRRSLNTPDWTAFPP